MSDAPLDLASFEELVKRRRSVRHFEPAPLADGLLERLLDAARWAPSGYNLQPTHFVVVTDAALKEALRPACLNQPQVVEAPVTVVFTGDRDVVHNNLERMLELELEVGAVNPGYERFLRQAVPKAFGRGPLGLGLVSRAVGGPIARLFRPVPHLPAVQPRTWLTKQVMLAAMNFMLAATAAGLATSPMEGFDEERVRRVLGIPRSQVVPVVIPVGTPVEEDLPKTRLPLESHVHRDGW